MNNELKDVTGATFIARRPFVPSADGPNRSCQSLPKGFPTRSSCIGEARSTHETMLTSSPP
jgi:hypothetical protein